MRIEPVKRRSGLQKSIFSKYFSVTASLVIASIVILGAIFLIFAAQYFKEDKYTLLQDNTRRAALVLEESYREENILRGDLTVSYLRLLSQTINANLFLTDSVGQTLYCTEKSPCIHTGNHVPAAILKQLDRLGEYSELGKMGGMYTDRFYTVGVPVSMDGARLGYVFASVHGSMEQQGFLTEMLKMFLISAVAVLAVTFIAVYFISVQLVKPLRQMSAAAQKFGRGELDTRLEVDSFDEIGQLAMNNMAQSLSTLEVSRRSFVANISHELKTPMTSISGFIDGILDGTIPPEKQTYYLTIVSEETKRLSRLVKSMLNLSRIEAGEMPINLSKLNLVDVICQTVFTFEQQIEKKNLTILGLDREKVMVEADPNLIHQVIYNLTENAVKFVNENGVIEFGIEERGDVTWVQVKNSGEGLSKEELPKIFDRFYKTDKSRGLDKNGVGLGLYIVRSVVNLHGGEILVNSVKGEYVEFVFSIPHRHPHPKPLPKFKKNS